MWIHKNKQQCLSVPIPISNYWTPLADQVEASDPPESLMAIHHTAPLSKCVCFSLPCSHIDSNSTSYHQRCPHLDNRTQLHPTFLANVQQHAICNPIPSTTTLREGVLNGMIPSAISNTGATLHALLLLTLLIPTGIPSKVVFHLPDGTMAVTSTVNKLLHNVREPAQVQTLFPPSTTILSSAPATLFTPDTPSSMTTKRSTITRRPPPKLLCWRMQCYGVGDAHATNSGVSHSTPMFGT
jgi:hypothetical protein